MHIGAGKIVLLTDYQHASGEHELRLVETKSHSNHRFSDGLYLLILVM